MFFLSLAERRSVYESGECDVSLGEATAIVCAERDLHLVVDIEPFRVVIHLLSLQCNTAHEPKGLVEVRKLELL